MVIVRIKATLIAIDQLFAAMFLGHADETLSAAAHRLGMKHTRWKTVESIIDAVFFWDRRKIGAFTFKHCRLSYQAEWDRKQYPSHYHA